MKTGSRMRPACRQRGSTYVGVLLLVAALGVGLAKSATVLVLQQQRSREASLLHIGAEIRSAIAHYYESGPGGRYPATLSDLVEDTRTGTAVRHLRRLYADPMGSGRAWGLVPGPDGTIMGVFSQAPGRPIKQRNFPPGNDGFEDSKAYSAWVFVDRRRGPDATSDTHAPRPPA